MRFTVAGVALLVPLLAAPATSVAQAPQGAPGPAPEGNLGAGAAMGGAQRESAGAAATGGAPPPRAPSPTSSPRPTDGGAPSR